MGVTQALWQRVGTAWAMLDDPKRAPAVTTAATVIAGTLQILQPKSTLVFLLSLLALTMVYKANMKPLHKIALAGLMLVVVMPVAGRKNTALTFLWVTLFINIALALGLNLVVGFAGLLDLGYIAFFAGGAYAYAIFGSTQAGKFLPQYAHLFPLPGWWFWVALPVAVAVACILGVALGLPVLRMRGDYLAIITLAFGEIIAVLANNLDKPVNITNGPRGIPGIQAPSLFGITLGTNTHFYFIGLIIALATFIIMRRLERSRIGRAWAAMKEDEVAARAMGVPITRLKIMAFVTGASFAGAMGQLFAVKQRFISPDSFTFLESIGVLAMIILGGLSSIQGAVAGAVTLTVLRLKILQDVGNAFQRLKLPSAFNLVQYQPMIFGMIMILMMIYRREGLIPAQRPQEDIEELEASVPGPPRPGVHVSS